MKVELTRTAEKQLKKLPKPKAKSIIGKMLLLSQNPLLGKPLSGEFKKQYSLRVWPYRIVYIINKSDKIVVVKAITHRQSVYKK